MNEENKFSCTVCASDIDDASTNSVQCMKCKNWSHMKCSMAKEVFDLIAKVGNDKGKRKRLILSGLLFFVCEPCGVSIQDPANNIPTQTTSSPTSSTSISSSTQVTLQETNATGIPEEKDSGNVQPPTQSPGNNENVGVSLGQGSVDNFSSKPICYYFKQGRCWHGKTGQKVVNGTKCQNIHSQKCLKYCRFGGDKLRPYGEGGPA